MGAGDEPQVRAIEHRVQIGAGSAQPTPTPDVLVERCETLLAVAVDVVGAAKAGLRTGLEPGLEQRIGGRPTLEFERAVAPAPFVLAGQTGLHPLEVGQAVGVVPVLHPRLLGPLLVVGGVAALEDHAVDAGRSAEHLAASVVHPATVHVRLGFALVLPVVETATDRKRQGGGHVDEHIPLPVGAPRFEHEDLVGGVGAEPIGQRTTGRAATHDDEVVLDRVG